MSASKNNFWIWLVVAVVIAGAVFTVIKFNNNDSSGDGPLAQVDTLTTDDWVKGKADSDVILVEYGDFQCPACANYQPLLKDLEEEFSNHVAFVYRHFPLRNIHPIAQIAGQATEAAGTQGKFWEMHDLLYENQDEWVNSGDSEDNFLEYANELGLDVAKFEDDMNSRAAKDGVNEDYDSGIAAGINSTPTFYLNGERIRPDSYEEFRDLVRTELKN